MSNDRRLVWSDDPKDKVDTGKPQKAVANEPADKSFTVIFRLEKNGRGGKTVTVMEGWPRNESYLKELTKDLKSKCGSGGTYLFENGKSIIEIQGDKRDQLKKLLTSMGIKFKGM